MFPINELKNIELQESKINGKHVIALLVVKPTDPGADEIINNFNYFDKRSDKFCSIYPIGYSMHFENNYYDVKKVNGINNTSFEYSDTCFIEVCKQLKNRLKNWSYSGSPELIVLQSKNPGTNNSYLDFRNYNYIDIDYGIKNNYIDTFPRFMERFLNACETETDSNKAIVKSNFSMLSIRKILEMAIQETPKLPKSIKQVINDTIFFKSSTTHC